MFGMGKSFYEVRYLEEEERTGETAKPGETGTQENKNGRSYNAEDDVSSAPAQRHV